jgi:hypothetical protein
LPIEGVLIVLKECGHALRAKLRLSMCEKFIHMHDAQSIYRRVTVPITIGTKTPESVSNLGTCDDSVAASDADVGLRNHLPEHVRRDAEYSAY